VLKKITSDNIVIMNLGSVSKINNFLGSPFPKKYHAIVKAEKFNETLPKPASTLFEFEKRKAMRKDRAEAGINATI